MTVFKPIINIRDRIHDRYLIYRYLNPFLSKSQKLPLNINDAVAVFSQPRSGSTWLTELLSNIPRSCIIDEPLRRGGYVPSELPSKDVRKISEIAKMNFFFSQPIAENEVWKDAYDVFDRMLKGQLPYLNLYREFSLKRLTDSKLVLTKFLYGSLLMHWFARNFSSKMILLVRHPLAVIASQLKHPGFNFKMPVDGVVFKGFRNEEMFDRYAEIIRSIDSPEEYLTFMWSVQIKHSLFHPQNNSRWLTVSYEKLVLDFENEINRIFNYLEIERPEKIFSLKNHPSQSTLSPSITQIRNNQQIGFWSSSLSKTQKRKIFNMLDQFEITLYNEKTEPDYNLLYEPYPKEPHEKLNKG